MSNPKLNPECIKTSIGGQAVLEGIMMRGPKKTALSVRLADGTIDTEEWDTPSRKAWYKRTPFIRGIFNFFDTLKEGYTCLMKSAEKAVSDEEPSAFEKKMQEKFGEKYDTFFEVFIFAMAGLIAIGLFVFLPTFLVKLIQPAISSTLALTAIEGALKITLFLLYLYFVSKTKDINRVFMYHGAEHKTIFCYEHGEELTVENVRKYIRFHPRCGTSFLVIVLLLSILVFSFVSWGNMWVRILLKLLCLPLVMSAAYECIKFAGRHDNILTRILSAPGLWTQRLTTREPDDEMIEVAIEAMKRVIPEDARDAQW